MTKLHYLAPPAGATKAKRRGRRGTGRQGPQDGRPRDEGPEGPQQGARRFRGWPAAPDAAHPQVKGFKNPFRIEYTPVNLAALEALGKDEVTPAVLVESGLARPKALIKVLGQGSLTRPVKVSAHAFSKAAEGAITAAGGSVEKLALPFGSGRPPASGNALMNR